MEHSEITLVKLYRKKGPIVFKFTLPENFTKGYIDNNYETRRREDTSNTDLAAMDQFVFDKDEEEELESREDRTRN